MTHTDAPTANNLLADLF